MKKDSLLRSLYVGEFVPADQFRLKSEKYAAFRREHEEKILAFTAQLNGEMRERFQVLYDELLMDIPYENEAAFAGGVYFGIKLMIEVMECKEDLI